MIKKRHKSNRADFEVPLSVGVGLRHQHYEDVLRSQSLSQLNRELDFIEVHAENFYADGGLALSLLKEVAQEIPTSIHATSLGLGSTTSIPFTVIKAFKKLIDEIAPVLVSDHACFAWGNNQSISRPLLLHAGDLLPIVFDQKNLQHFSNNVDQVQQVIGRQLLIENLSSYLTLPGNTMHEFDFLQDVCLNTGCGLLVDINNLNVNMINLKSNHVLFDVKEILNGIDRQYVGEIHLAGCQAPKDGELMIDDHSQQVEVQVWQAYQYALQKFGSTPTLIEWDNNLPSWSTLTNEAKKAKKYARGVLQWVQKTKR